MFQSYCIDGEMERVKREREKKGGEKGRQIHAGESRGREGGCGRSPTGRQQSINQ